jgi:DNA-binding MarR family transcriptional regulator
MKTTPSTHEDVTELVLLILSVYGDLHSNGLALTKPFGQSPARWQLMGELGRQPLTVSQAARRIGNTRQSVQRQANEMIKDGLVHYTDNPDHRRSPRVCLTQKGIEILNRINKKQVTWATQIGRRMERRAIKETVWGLRKLAAALRTEESRLFGGPPPETDS